MPDAYQLIEKGIRKALENGESPERVLAEAREDIYSASEERNPFGEDPRTRLIRSAPAFENHKDARTTAKAFNDTELWKIREMIYEENLDKVLLPESNIQKLPSNDPPTSKALHRVVKAFELLESIDFENLDNDAKKMYGRLLADMRDMRKRLKERDSNPIRVYPDLEEDPSVAELIRMEGKA